jgi:hypothetical protein
MFFSDSVHILGGYGCSKRRLHYITVHCLAGDAVLIAPVSRQIPWYQGILQGISCFSGVLDAIS